jgi:hypothetical protein
MMGQRVDELAMKKSNNRITLNPSDKGYVYY